MISVEFAPNETTQDALFALKLLVQPWRWRRGKEITKLRQRLRKRFFSDKNDIYFFLTGRCAIYHFLKSLNLEKNSEVLVQGFTCEAVVLPILAQKLKPVYVDVNKSDLSMNLGSLKQQYTPNARVLILQHTFSIIPSERSKILAFAKEKKLTVLEDLAHGFDLSLFNSKILRTSLLLSFGRSKSLSGVFGGAIVTSNKKIADYMGRVEKNLKYPSTLFLSKMALYKALSVAIKATYPIYLGKLLHVIAKYTKLSPAEITNKEKMGEYDELYAKAFPNISALFILQQLNRFNDVYRKKMLISRYYQDKFHQEKHYGQSFIRFPYIAKNRDLLRKKLRQKGIILGSWYDQVIAPKQLDLKKIGYQENTCSEAEKLCKTVVNLPTFVTKKQAQQIVTYINKYDVNKK